MSAPKKLAAGIALNNPMCYPKPRAASGAEFPRLNALMLLGSWPRGTRRHKGFRGMSRSPFLTILLAAALVAQAVIVNWGHSHEHVAAGAHVHLGDVGSWHHHHASGVQSHAGSSHEHPPLPNRPTDKDDCSVCRHLALAAILTFDLEATAIGDAAERVRDGESSLVPTIAIGLRRPRSPPS